MIQYIIKLEKNMNNIELVDYDTTKNNKNKLKWKLEKITIHDFLSPYTNINHLYIKYIQM